MNLEAPLFDKICSNRRKDARIFSTETIRASLCRLLRSDGMVRRIFRCFSQGKA
jgi:hypothetical protein